MASCELSSYAPSVGGRVISFKDAVNDSTKHSLPATAAHHASIMTASALCHQVNSVHVCLCAVDTMLVKLASQYLLQFIWPVIKLHTLLHVINTLLSPPMLRLSG